MSEDLTMSEDVTPTNDVICPVCGQFMSLQYTVRRAFSVDLNVFQCEPCKISTAKPVGGNSLRSDHSPASSI
jgi:ribosomal protein S27E